MKNIHHARPTVILPMDFHRPGWLCQRCDEQVDIDEACGSPARCPKCHKATTVWIPTAEPITEVRERGEAFRPERKYVTKDEGRFMFEDMLKKIEDGTAAGEEGG